MNEKKLLEIFGQANLISKSLDIIEKLAEIGIADEDGNIYDDNDLHDIKNLIIKAREIKENNFFEDLKN